MSDTQRTSIAWWRDGRMWAGAVAGILAAVIGSVVVVKMSEAKPILTYKGGTVTRFQGEQSKVAIVGVTVTNEGNKEADDVVCTLPMADVKEVVATPDTLRPTVATGKGSINVTVSVLNPGETLQVVALVGEGGQVQPTVVPIVRGKGVVGKESADKEIATTLFWAWTAIPVLVLIASWVIVWLAGRKANESEQSMKAGIDALRTANERLDTANELLREARRILPPTPPAG